MKCRSTGVLRQGNGNNETYTSSAGTVCCLLEKKDLRIFLKHVRMDQHLVIVSEGFYGI